MTEPVVLPAFEEFGDQGVSALEKPEEAVAATQAVLKDDRDAGRPVIDSPGDNLVTLERGICREGTWYRDAEVRELNGSDEEALAAAGVGNSSYKVFETLLLRGVVRVGGEAMSRTVAGELLIGDRELLILAIRRATFGEDLEFERLPCPHCGELTDLTVPLGAIPTVRLDDPERVEFEVPMRHGNKAVVRLPNGDDQAAVFNLQSSGNKARQDSEILNRCVLRLVYTDGREVARPPAQTLGMRQRRSLLQFLTDTQPGPRYADFTWTHETCGKEVELPITLAVLFRGM
ncbi:hypothetical protein [Streptomyces sp. NPDC017260]|uniref:T4 family baseplate hub assembly chaperone n=1 Tax=unclassified Streptomyces TaxID=2593676 RepID=UPI00379D3DD7